MSYEDLTCDECGSYGDVICIDCKLGGWDYCENCIEEHSCWADAPEEERSDPRNLAGNAPEPESED